MPTQEQELDLPVQQLQNYSIQEIINNRLQKDRADHYHNPDCWHASDLGQCLTGAYLRRSGVPADEEFDDRTLRVFSVGSAMEKWLTDLLIEDAKLNKDFACATQVSMKHDGYDLEGHADLIVSKNGRPLIYEIKSRQSRAFTYMVDHNEGANHHHKMQLWVYLWLKNIDEGRIIYLSKDDLRTAEFVVRRDDPEIEAAVMKELKILNEAWKQKLPPPVIYTDKDWQARYCRWHKQCVSQSKYLNI